MGRKERKENEAAIGQTQGVVSDLQQRVNDLTEEYEDYQAIVRDYDGFIASQNSIIDEQTNAMQAAQTRANQYQGNLDLAWQQRTAMERQHKQYLASFESRYNETKPAADQAYALLKQAAVALSNARDDYDAAVKSLDQWNAQLDELKREMARIEGGSTETFDAVNINIRLTEIQNGMQKSQNQVNERELNLRTKQTAHQQAKEKYDRDSAPFKLAESQLEQAREKCNKEIEASDEAIRTIEADLAQAQREADAASREIVKAQQKIAIAPEVRNDPSRVVAKEGELGAISGSLEAERQRLGELTARGEELNTQHKRRWIIVVIIVIIFLAVVLPQFSRCMAGF